MLVIEKNKWTQTYRFLAFHNQHFGWHSGNISLQTRSSSFAYSLISMGYGLLKAIESPIRSPQHDVLLKMNQS